MIDFDGRYSYYSASTTYAKGDIVEWSNGMIYESQHGGNTNNGINPDFRVFPHWKLVGISRDLLDWLRLSDKLSFPSAPIC